MTDDLAQRIWDNQIERFGRKSAGRCPDCGHKIKDFFDHIAIECNADMSEQEIASLLNSNHPTVQASDES